ncbi:MAG TPA: GNAT family N-acetyltransferase [Solirubrobacteraceae bacterium]|jgi:ribosomal protein S18 acetylase RimI-like enzyme
MTPAHSVRALPSHAITGELVRLGALLIDCVRAGASIGFLDPLSAADAESFWARIQRAVAAERAVLFVGEIEQGEIAGTVVLDIDTLPNQPHRATVSKLLVHTAARRQGLGEALMRELERTALHAGRWLLTLDTATGEAERLYTRLGYSAAGTIPDYALNPDSTLTPTTFFYKRLGERR